MPLNLSVLPILPAKPFQQPLLLVFRIAQAANLDSVLYGGFIPVYLHDLERQIDPERFLAKIGFSERLRVAVMTSGKAGGLQVREPLKAVYAWNRLKRPDG